MVRPLIPALLLLIAVTLILSGSVLWTQAIGAGWGPTPMKAVRKMLELAELKEDDTVYDLGSGDGRIVIEAAKRYGARGVGIEADPLRVAVSRLIVRLKGVRGLVTIVRGNFFRESFAEASVVTLFLRQKTNRRLKQKLLELREGTRIVTYTWTIDGWTPALSDERRKVHMYVVNRSDRCERDRFADASKSENDGPCRNPKDGRLLRTTRPGQGDTLRK